MSDGQQTVVPDEEICELGELAIGALRNRFADLYGKPPPVRLGKDLLIRAVAYRIQEQAEGGLARVLCRRVVILARELRETGRIRVNNGPLVKPGMRLIRDWQGQTHEVTITDDGYIYRDKQYRSLSPIAREITGTRWSGPAFFGLRDRNRAV